MSAITSVRLPAVRGETPIRETVDRLGKEGKSGVVVLGKEGPVVLTLRALNNSLVGLGSSDGSMSDVTASARSKRGPAVKKSLFGSRAPTRSVLAAAQDDYILERLDGDSAMVATDPSRAAELSQPSRLCRCTRDPSHLVLVPVGDRSTVCPYDGAPLICD